MSTPGTQPNNNCGFDQSIPQYQESLGRFFAPPVENAFYGTLENAPRTKASTPYLNGLYGYMYQTVVPAWWQNSMPTSANGCLTHDVDKPCCDSPWNSRTRSYPSMALPFYKK